MENKKTYVTTKELVKHKKEVEKMIKTAFKEFKKWDVKHDKKLVKKNKK